MEYATRVWLAEHGLEVLANDPDRFTESEREIIHLFTTGYSYRQVCERLSCSGEALERSMVAIESKLDPPGDGRARVREPRRPFPSADSGEATPSGRPSEGDRSR